MKKNKTSNLTNNIENVKYYIPEGDNRKREVCDTCGFINYKNPKIIVGAVIEFQKKILLCKRAIEPSFGLWTIPAGYLETNESVEDGALREINEEAGLTPKITSLLSIYSLKHISQVQIIFKGEAHNNILNPGEETLEAKYFLWDDIPWNSLAFPSVSWSLNHFKESIDDNKNIFPKTNPT